MELKVSAGSKQVAWQAKQRAKGRCVNCGRVPPAGKKTCAVCLGKRRESYLSMKGSQ